MRTSGNRPPTTRRSWSGFGLSRPVRPMGVIKAIEGPGQAFALALQ